MNINMEYIITIKNAKVKTANRISIDGFILYTGGTDTKCKFDYIRNFFIISICTIV